jgi:hypothetical protein
MTKSIGILTIATNHYVEYWENMVNSSYNRAFPNSQVTYHVFTDQPERISKFTKENSINGVKVHRIESLGWPAATLQRYSVYLGHAAHLNEDFLMHLDADMLVRESAEFIFDDFSWKNGMLLVLHPGFYRPAQPLQLMKIYMRDPLLLLKDIYRKVWIGGIGAWESNPKSKAFVARVNRKKYVCGGAWIGYRAAFLKLVDDLTKSVEADLKEGFIAKWHDESHLNAWFSMNECHVIDPALCHDNSYQYLKSIRPIITAVDKNVS